MDPVCWEQRTNKTGKPISTPMHNGWLSAGGKLPSLVFRPRLGSLLKAGQSLGCLLRPVRPGSLQALTGHSLTPCWLRW